MRAEDIRERLRRLPFRPFRIFLSDQSNYLVRHPDQVVLTASTLVLTTPTSEAHSSDIADCLALSLVHITRVEPMPLPAPPPTVN